MVAFAALADDTRLGIVDALADGDRSVNELVELFPISQPAVSRHLRILRSAGVVTADKDGPRRVYRLNPEAVVELEEWAKARRARWEGRLDQLGHHLDRMAAREGRRR